MFKFFLHRLFNGFAVLLLVILIISGIIYAAPVDPTRLTFGERSDNATVKAKREQLGLDDPFWLQMGKYLNDISPLGFHSESEKSTFGFKKPNFRESYQSGRGVGDILSDAIPQTAILALVAMFFATVMGIFLGVVAALRPHSWWNTSAIVASVLGYSLPSYIVAMIFALIFGYWCSDWTGLNIQGSLFELNDLGDEVVVWKNILLPALALGIRPVALIMQLTRATMLETLKMDYVRTAHAKGLPKWTVVIKHALRNALNPVVTAISGWFAGLLAGAFFVENVFGYNGLGQVTVNALLNFDIPVVLGCVLFTASVFVVINVLVDIFYALLDPRIRVE